MLAEVWDEFPGTPAAGQADPDNESGRGLMLIEAVCDRLELGDRTGWTGKVVPAELRIP